MSKQKRRVKRVKAWLVYDRKIGDVWREKVNGLPMLWSTTKGLGVGVPNLSHVSCIIEYTPPTPPVRRPRGSK